MLVAKFIEPEAAIFPLQKKAQNFGQATVLFLVLCGNIKHRFRTLTLRAVSAQNG